MEAILNGKKQISILSKNLLGFIKRTTNRIKEILIIGENN